MDWQQHLGDLVITDSSCYIIFEPLPHSIVAHFGQLVELIRADVVAHQ